MHYANRRMMWPAVAGLATVLLSMSSGCQSDGAKSSRPLAADASADAAGPTAVHPQYVIRDALQELGEDAILFHQWVMTLSDPFFEGRSPDTRGNQIAAEYLAFHFDKIGLTPAFEEEILTPGGEAVVNYRASYEQQLDVNGRLEVKHAEVSYTAGGRTVTLEEGEAFNPLAGNERVSGEVVFVGYSIDDGPEGYSSFAPDEDLTGKIALMLRFEPMDGQGKSRWSESDRWSRHAGLIGKMREVAERGAEGVLLVTPAVADDPRAERLASVQSVRLTGIDVPVAALTPNAANSFVKVADSQGRSLSELQALADDGWQGGITLNSGGATMTLDMKLERALHETSNVAAILDGAGSLKDEFVVIGGHYDHVGYNHLGGGRGPVGELYPGGDDNSSGTAGVLLAAHKLKKYYDSLGANVDRRSILFIGFTAEEMGLLGSSHFVEHMPIDASKINAMINLDMIGRLSDAELEVSGFGTAEEFDEILPPLFEQVGLEVSTSDSGFGPSDHTNFHRKGIPVLHFFTGLHTEYHTPLDTPEKVNFYGGVLISDLVVEVTKRFAMDARLTPVETSGGQMRSGGPRARVRLGIMPDSYADDDASGVLIGRVFDDTTASKGGMKAGDRLVRWNGEELADIQAMMEHLREANPGDRVRVVVIRDGEEVTLDLTLEARGEEG